LLHGSSPSAAGAGHFQTFGSCTLIGL
jgi:hypothetical protein